MNFYEEEEELDENTGNISTDDLGLVQLVKVNPGLWNNTLKKYSNADDKNLAWSILGQSLSTPLSGPDAQKKFLNLRSTFGRLHKKILQSQPTSGSSGDQFVFKPTWPLYDELLFLKDVIRPRKTKSNFVNLAHVPVPKKSPSTQLLEKSTFMPVLKISQYPLIENTMPQQLSKVNTPLKQTESATTVDDSSSLSSSQSVTESSTFNNSFYDSQLHISDTGSVIHIDTKPEELRSRKKMKLQAPPPDDYFNKKKIKDEEDIKVLKDMANSMRDMTATLTSSTVSKLGMNQDSSSGLAEKLNPEIEAFLQILRGSLARIPPTSRLTCLIELLPIMQKYERA